MSMMIRLEIAFAGRDGENVLVITMPSQPVTQ